MNNEDIDIWNEKMFKNFFGRISKNPKNTQTKPYFAHVIPIYYFVSN